MYTQALNTSEAEDRHIEDAARAAGFQARFDAEERIEPNGCVAVSRAVGNKRIVAAGRIIDTGGIARKRIDSIGCISRPGGVARKRVDSAGGVGGI